MRKSRQVAVLIAIAAAALPAPPAAATPTLHDAVLRYLQSRNGAEAVAVHDYRAKRDYLVYKDRTVWTASIVKVEILQALLHRRNGQLSSYEKSEAKRMIENSDNDAAEELWERIGAGRGLDSFSKLAGLTDTKSDPRGRWGRTITSARDQMKLIQLLEFANKLLGDASRSYVRGLMHNVESDQRWGSCAHAPTGAWTMNKNGWSPIADDNGYWAVNSDCYVWSKTKRYALVVLDKHLASESYGIATIQGVAAIVVKYMANEPA